MQIAPITIHPAFQKAGAYFGVRIKTVPVDKDMRCDLQAMAEAITSNTIALAVSAPQYPHGQKERKVGLEEGAGDIGQEGRQKGRCVCVCNMYV